MFEEVVIHLPNGMQVIVWNSGEEVELGIVDEQGYAVTDKKLTVNEADRLSTVAHSP